MAYVAHHPPYHRVPALHPHWWRESFSDYLAGIDGLWVVSFAFGVLVTGSALVFLIPMAIFS